MADVGAPDVVAQGEAGFGHLTPVKKTGVASLGLMAALGLGGNVYQGFGDHTDATSLTEIQTGLTHVIESMDQRHSQAMTQCFFLLAGVDIPEPQPVVVPAPLPPEDEEPTG